MSAPCPYCSGSFQFTPLREGRLRSWWWSFPLEYFNSRPYVRGDTNVSIFRLSNVYFNSRPYVRGDTTRFMMM